jgi:branched-chain amino acid transport system permease protein
MQELESSLILGALLGLVYALSGAGLVAIYRTSKVINFAQGDVAAVGLYCALPLAAARVPYALVALIVVAACTVVSMLMGVGVSFISNRHNVLYANLATIGLALVIRGLLADTQGSLPQGFPSAGSSFLFHLGDVGISAANVLLVGVVIVCFLGLGLLFDRTRVGAAMRALSERPSTSRALGLPTIRLNLMAWGIGGVLAGLAGVVVAPIYLVTPTSVDNIVIYGFAAVVVGGFDSITGSLVAGVAIGVLTNLVAQYTSPNLVLFAVFVLMVIVLIFRPYGLLGRAPLQRV